MPTNTKNLGRYKYYLKISAKNLTLTVEIIMVLKKLTMDPIMLHAETNHIIFETILKIYNIFCRFLKISKFKKVKELLVKYGIQMNTNGSKMSKPTHLMHTPGSMLQKNLI